ELVAVLGTHAHRTWTRMGDGRPLAISPDGSLVAAGGQHSPLRVWDVKSRSLKTELQVGYTGYPAVFSHDGRRVYADRVGVWDLAGPAETNPWVDGPAEQGFPLRFFPDGSAVITQSNRVSLWDLTAKPARLVASVDAPPPGAVSVTPDCKRMAVVDSDRG